jgi:hypothetical protein
MYVSVIHSYAIREASNEMTQHVLLTLSRDSFFSNTLFYYVAAEGERRRYLFYS